MPQTEEKLSCLLPSEAKALYQKITLSHRWIGWWGNIKTN
ncbi:hypothetical protein CWATWH0401_871 [Crocosphaera watsonii WH 0401]|uniref:Uncharacterized protein n=1 Tax=Crocosphaera watsonii WH 0401 TaxID=555881 RepID=T2JGD6_CROWT|nr:hypothetical protein CWATWH0401_871 [Crocosphaera watsonii WH 0401]